MSTIIYPIYTLMTHREFEWLWGIDKSEEKILEKRNEEEKEKLREELEVTYELIEEEYNKKRFKLSIKGEKSEYLCDSSEDMEIIKLEDFPGKNEIEKIQLENKNIYLTLESIKLLRYGTGYIKLKIEKDSDSKKLEPEEIGELKKAVDKKIKYKIWDCVKDIKYKIIYKKDEKEIFEEEREALTGITFPLMKEKYFEEFYHIYNNGDGDALKILRYEIHEESKEPEILESDGVKDENLAEILCMLHHGYLLCGKKVDRLTIYTDKVWYKTKVYVDVRKGEYRPVMAYSRGLMNSINLLKDMFHELIAVNTKKINDKDNEEKRYGSIRKSVDKRIFCLDRGIGAIADYSEENISIRITDDMRATQRALETLEPAILTIGIIVLLDLIYKNMFSEIVSFLNPGIYPLAIVTLSILFSLFWISITVIGYVRSFWLAVGEFKDPDDVFRDTFLLVFSLGIVALSISTVRGYFELENAYVLIFLFLGMVLVIFCLFAIISKSKSEWFWVVFIFLLSSVTVLFINPGLGIEYKLFLFYIICMLLWFFGWFTKKIGAHISEGRETELWRDFKKKLRYETFKKRIDEYRDPYEGWHFGEVFEKFIKEYKKERTEETKRRLIKYIVILFQGLAVTFTLGYLIEHEKFILFIAAVASILTTAIELQYLLSLREDINKKTEITKYISQYSIFALILSAIADLHYIPAMIFVHSNQEIAISLAFGALIANAIALVLVISDTLIWKKTRYISAEIV